MSFAVIVKERDDGDFHTVMAFSLLLQDELNYKVEDFLTDTKLYLEEANEGDVFHIVELENVEDVLDGDMVREAMRNGTLQ